MDRLTAALESMRARVAAAKTPDLEARLQEALDVQQALIETETELSDQLPKWRELLDLHLQMKAHVRLEEKVKALELENERRQKVVDELRAEQEAIAAEVEI